MNFWPQVTYFNGMTEAPDETAQGGWLDLVTKPGFSYLMASIKYLRDGEYRVDRIEEDGQRDMVGIFLDDGAQPLGIGVFRGLFQEVQGDGGAARGFVGGLDGEFALAVRGPAPALLVPGLARNDLDAVGDHEGGIEADAELADQRHILARIAGQLLHEGRGAGAGDGAEIVDQLVMVHADAVVGDGERVLIFVRR